MNLEQLARNYTAATFLEPEKVKGIITADAMVSGGALPQPIPLVEGLKNASGFSRLSRTPGWKSIRSRSTGATRPA